MGAEALCVLEPMQMEGARDLHSLPSSMNINKAFDKEWEGLSTSELLDAPLSAFEGLTEAHDVTFKALGLKVIRDLGTWKYFLFARSLCALAEAESVDGSS